MWIVVGLDSCGGMRESCFGVRKFGWDEREGSGGVRYCYGGMRERVVVGLDSCGGMRERIVLR